MIEPRNPQGPAGARRLGGHGAKSEAVREAAVLALLSERSITAAAERCGVNERTLRHWLDEPAFREEFEHARRVVFQAGIGRIQALTVKAVDTLEDLPDVADAPSVRLGAAKTITELGIHQYEAEVIMRKLEEIEQARNWRR